MRQNLNRTISPPLQEIGQVRVSAPEKHSLKNGIELIAINGGTQDVVKIELLFKGGKWFESQKLIASATCNMLKEGTSKMDSRQIAEQFDFYGASVSTQSVSDFDSITVHCMNKHLNAVLPMVYELITDSIFPEEELEILLGKSVQKYKINLEKPDFLAHREFKNCLFGEIHPYGRKHHFEDYSNINPELLKSHWKKIYCAGNCKIFASGKLNDKSIDILNEVFGNSGWSQGESLLATNHSENPSKTKDVSKKKKNSLQSAIHIGMKTVNKTHDDFMGLSILVTVLGGYFGSRLMANIREEKGYTYGIYSYLSSLLNAGYLNIATEVGGQYEEATVKEIFLELNRLKSELIEKRELEMVKNYLLGKTLGSMDGPFKLADTVKGLLTYNLDLSYIDKFVDLLKSIEAPTLKNLANKYFENDEIYKVVVG